MQIFKNWLIRLYLSHLLPIVDLEQVLTTNKQGHILLNGHLIDKKKLDDLKQEVILFKNTALWGILSNTLKHQAEVTIFNKSKDYQDLMNGKMILYTISVQNSIVTIIDKAKN